ncbi:putative GTPase [Desulfurella amilsii]|uniref:Putative GTPase n=1 Tax=Desulfurella amilsii TaxID=1562698 RepID=A0A1X4XVC1_9BACT|nr:dynamin family protein [Desulfurella amilsii]OSS41474.1 putative GTPase [Desulfurella amilsii]
MVNLEQAIQSSIQALKALPLDFSHLSAIEDKIQSKQFNFVVIGQFKRGKSTLINALIGKDILPISVLPLTSIVTIINYGEQKAVVCFKGGSCKNIELNEISFFVTEKYNPNNKLNVEYVEIFYPADFLKNSVRIIDTPGIGSVYEHNSDVSYQFLPKADASLFVLSPDPPITQAEIEFLKDAQKYIDKFFFLLNKIDNFKPNELKEIIEFNRSVIENLVSKKVDIIPISAKLAQEARFESNKDKQEQSNIEKLYHRLDNFIKEEQASVFWYSIINNLIRYIDTQMNFFKLNLASLSMSQAKLQEKIKLFEDSLEKLELDEYIYWLENKTKQVINVLDKDILTLKEQLPQLISKITDYFNTLNTSSTSMLNEQLKSYLQGQIEEIFSVFLQIENQKIGQLVEDIYNQLLEKINALIDNITKTAEEVFEVELSKLTQVEQLIEKSEFYFLIKEQPGVLDIMVDFFKSKLPLFLGKKVIYKSISERSVELFDRHCGRLRYDFVKRIKETAQKFSSQVEEKLNQNIDAIKDILNAALQKQNDEQRQNEINKIDNCIKSLSSIRTNLENLKNQLKQDGKF